ncbi:type I restriction endonuclease subunit S [Priestia megaterium]|uniref:restriction endonuclease subunit S n=1 Tax=Priestia megaterium TaxID=1404 RepID=UPI000BF3F1FE|nr:restriction endonuclease subunit S [Priestia megaterium]PEU68115.1 type I restriction endonuclease subunit S [Priestia megaterium]
MENKLKAKIRFESFTEDWEKRKFSDIVSRVSKQSNDANVPKVEFEDIVSGEGQLNKDISCKFDDRKGIAFEPNFILFGKLRPYLKKWLLPNFKGIALGDFWVFESKNSSSIFNYYLIQTSEYQIVANLSSGTKMPRSDWKTVSETEFRVPSIDEQTKIGEFFKRIDDTIALHQQELTALKQTKLGFLQKMFPKEGESVPEVRFPEFSGDWKQCKFEDVLNKQDGIRRGPFGSALKKEFFVKDSDYAVYEQQNAIYDNYKTRYNISKEKFEELKNFQLSEGDFILSGAGTIGRISRVPKGIKQGVFNQALIRFKIDEDITDSEYFIQWIRSESMQKKLTGGNPGSAITNLVPMSEVKKWNVMVPIKNEQIKIGNFLKQLDRTIALHQCELDTLKETKKAFLQKMFA